MKKHGKTALIAGVAAALLAGAIGWELIRGMYTPPPKQPDPENRRQAEAIFQRTGGDLRGISDEEYDTLEMFIASGGERPAGFVEIPAKPKESSEQRRRRIYLNTWGDPKQAGKYITQFSGAPGGGYPGSGGYPATRETEPRK